jgi:uncharacterized protein YdeI (YjbR/CyaY-like superfamily)
MTKASNRPIHEFVSADEWEQWLQEHFKTSQGIWIRVFNTGGHTPSVTYEEAAERAIPYLWSGGQKRMYDEHSWIQLFRPKWLRGRSASQHPRRMAGRPV